MTFQLAMPSPVQRVVMGLYSCTVFVSEVSYPL